MKKFSKLLIVLLVLSVVLAASVIAISASENDTATYTAEDGTEKQDTFANALANAKSGTTVKLEGNGCALEEDYTVTKDITVNLNGKTLTLGSNAKFTFNAKVNFTITGEGKIAIAGALFSSGSVNLNATEEDSTALNVNVLAQGSGIDIVQNASANVNVVYAKSGTWTFKGVNIDAGTTTAQTIKGEGDAKYIFAGCNVKAMGAASQNAYVLQICESSYVKADWSTFYAAGGAVLNPAGHADKTVADFTNCALYYVQPNALTNKANEGGIVGSYCNFNGDINFTDCTISGGHRIFCTSVTSANTGKIVLKGTLVQHNGIKTGVLVRCNDIIVGEGSAITFVKATTSIVNDGNVQTDTGGTKYVIFEEGSRMDYKVYNAIKTTETHIRFRDVVDGVETLVLPSQSTQHTIIYDPAGSVDAPFKVIKRTYDESGNETTPKGIDPGTIILQETGFGIKADEILWVAGTNKSKNGYNSSTLMFPSAYLGWNKQGTLSSVTHGENSMLRYDTTTASPKTTLSYYSGGNEGIVFNSKHVIVMDFDIGTDSELGYPDMNIKYNVRNSTGGGGGDIANIIKIEKNSFTNAATNGDVNASDIAVDRENWMHITFVVYPNVAEDVGSATAAKDNGKSYCYVNGQLIGTQCAYKAGAGKVYGPRIDIQTTSTLGTSLVIDNVTIRTYDSYKSGESYENQTPTAYFLPEGSYNNGPVKGSGVEIGGVRVKDVNAALTAGAEIGVVPELTADITKAQTVNVNGTIDRKSVV